MDRRTEVELQRLAARGALDLHLVVGQAEAARQRAVVELQDEVAAAALVAASTAQVMWKRPYGVGGRREAARSHDAHARQARFALILEAVAIGVVEHLAGDVRAVERRIRHDAHRRGRFARQRVAGQPCTACARLTNSPSLTPAPTASSSSSVVLRRCSTIARSLQISSRPATARLDRHAVDARRAFDVAEARREAVDDAHVEQRHVRDVLVRDDVRHQLAARRRSGAASSWRSRARPAGPDRPGCGC